MAAIWLNGRSLDDNEIVEELRNRFFLNTDSARIKKHTDILCSEGTLVCLPSGSYKVSERAAKEFEETIKDAEDVAAAAKRKFIVSFGPACPSVPVEEGWRSFNEDFLIPLVREVGARTYELISGTRLQLDRTIRFPEYLGRFPAESRQLVRNAVLAYLDPTDSQVRSYILRYLSAYFLVEAGNLDKQTLDSLAKVAKKPPAFNIFLDTNFLFSILGLHDNPSNEAAHSLMQLLTQLPEDIKSQLYVLPPTLDEARGVLGVQKDFLRGVRVTPNIADAMPGVALSGIAQRFVEASRQAGHSISADDYFDPYLNDLIRVLRSKNIELFNQNVDAYRLKQEVIDSLLDQLDFEKRKYGDKGRTYEQLLHDVVLWYFVLDKRPAHVESPLEATYWVVTVDYHFLGFDAFRRRNAQKQLAICLHPMALIQLLQFWLPRTAQFEEAVMGSLRWPFLFQEFDPQAEKTTVRILEVLARFENVGDLPRDVITGILLDDALRSKLSVEKDVERRVELVKEALISRTEKLQSELAQENERVRAELKAAEEVSGRLERLAREQATTIASLEQQARGQESSLSQANTKLLEEVKSREKVEERLAKIEEAVEKEGTRRRRILFSAVSLALVVVAIAAPCLLLWLPQSRWINWKTELAAWALALLLWAWIVGLLARRYGGVTAWGPFERFVSFRKALFAACGTVILGAIGNALWELIKALRS
jgi:hypothetical protein